MAAATCVLTWINWLFMSRSSCLIAFSGSSARSIASLTFDLTSSEILSSKPT